MPMSTIFKDGASFWYCTYILCISSLVQYIQVGTVLKSFHMLQFVVLFKNWQPSARTACALNGNLTQGLQPIGWITQECRVLECRDFPKSGQYSTSQKRKKLDLTNHHMNIRQPVTMSWEDSYSPPKRCWQPAIFLTNDTFCMATQAT